MWLMKTLLTSGCTNQRGAGHKALVLKIPKSRILTETDGPFAKFRNDPLMPWDSGIAEKQLAALWGISQMEVNAQLVDNFKVLCTS